jgi:hypothetical protein
MLDFEMDEIAHQWRVPWQKESSQLKPSKTRCLAPIQKRVRKGEVLFWRINFGRKFGIGITAPPPESNLGMRDKGNASTGLHLNYKIKNGSLQNHNIEARLTDSGSLVQNGFQS